MVALLVVTLASLILAAVTSAVAWRVVGEERRRSQARIRTLAAEIHGTDHVASELFAAAEGRAPIPRGPQRGSRVGVEVRAGVAIALGVFAVGAAAALAVVLSAGPRTVTPAPVAPAAAVADTPLELIALGHQRDGDRLTVRGVVRNRADGAAVSQLSPVVFVFDHDGGFVASGRGTIEASTLVPGADSTFVVGVPGITDVGRYRVSFRTDDRIIPHVDRREGSRPQESAK